MSTDQKNTFLAGEADAWLTRNRDTLAHYNPSQDIVIKLLCNLLRPKSAIAEVGCSLAYRVAHLVHTNGGKGFGLDPSQSAVVQAQKLHPRLQIQLGTADNLPWESASMDCIIYGFCLYLCDRKDLFRIAMEGDRVLRDGAFLVILDFCPPSPYRNPYSHKAGLYSYKMDHSRLWTWNPSYTEYSRELCAHAEGDSLSNPDQRIAITVLKKEVAYSFPEAPRFHEAT